MTAFLSRLLRLLLLVWLLFAASPLPALTWGYDAQTRHVNTGYDVRSLVATDHDSASTLLSNENERRSVETGGSFAHFAEFLAAKEAVPTIGGRLPINSKYAGQVHPSGIQFTEQGFPNFGPVSKAEVQLQGLTAKGVKP